jgi:flagellar hook-associated protein 2
MPIRITGMSSGLDIDKIVSDLMRVERIPLDKLKGKKTLTTWKMDLYRGINAQLDSFRSKLNSLRFGGDWQLAKATSTDESSVSVSASGSAAAATHTIEVTSLARGAIKSSGNPGISNASLQGSALAGSTNITAGVNDQLNITLDGVRKTITLSAGTYNNAELQAELQTKIDAAFGANKLNVGLSGGQLNLTPVGTSVPQVVVESVSGNSGLASLGFTDQQSYKVNRNVQLGSIASKFSAGPLTFGDFTINGQKISYSSTDTLSDIINRVNQSAAGVIMSYDEISDKITLTSKEIGSTAKIDIQDGTGNFATAIRMDATVATGADANVKIDGIQSYRSSNTFTIDGVTYTLKKEGTGTIHATVAKDTDAILKKVKEFVESYNETIDLLNKRLKEARFRDYPPLTDDQKKEMNEKDIELWEEKAKSGLLRNDSILAEALTSLRSIATKTVTGISSSYNSLHLIGIDTVPYSSLTPNDNGKLVYDEAKLKAAIEKDPDGVIRMFANQSDASSAKGIAQAMYEQANASISQLITKAGGVGAIMNDINTELGLQVNDLEEEIESFQARLTRMEDYYYKKFGAMEKAISASNSQLAWLMQQFG